MIVIRLIKWLHTLWLFLSGRHYIYHKRPIIEKPTKQKEETFTVKQSEYIEFLIFKKNGGIN